MRESISAVLASQFVGLCFSIHMTLIEEMKENAAIFIVLRDDEEGTCQRRKANRKVRFQPRKEKV